MTTGKPEMPDLAALRRSLGMPAVGVRLDPTQTVRLLAALEAGRAPLPDDALEWARRALGVHARTA